MTMRRCIIARSHLETVLAVTGDDQKFHHIKPLLHQLLSDIEEIRQQEIAYHRVDSNVIPLFSESHPFGADEAAPGFYKK